jgi:transcriptional regulator with XRE-family HTH domain
MNDRLATWIVGEARKNNLSLREVARRAHVSQTTVAKLANGERIPRAQTCQALAGVFGVSPEHVQRLAGLLPAPLPRVTDHRVTYQVDTADLLDRLLELWASLTPGNQALVLELMANLVHPIEPRIIGEEAGQ